MSILSSCILCESVKLLNLILQCLRLCNANVVEWSNMNLSTTVKKTAYLGVSVCGGQLFLML